MSLWQLCHGCGPKDDTERLESTEFSEKEKKGAIYGKNEQSNKIGNKRTSTLFYHFLIFLAQQLF